MSYLHDPIKLHRVRPSIRREQGVVIVLALFMVALVAAIAYIMMMRLQRDTERTMLILRDTQAEFYAQGSIVWAIDVLQKNLDKQKPNQRVDIVPIQSPVNVVNGYQISSVIYDMQGRFNLNSLDQPETYANFRRLIRAVVPNIAEDKAQEIARAVGDWISSARSDQTEFNRYYLGLPLPYRAAHRLMLSSSELRLVKGMTPALFAALQPYVVALPYGTSMNIQSAPAPVLLTLSPNMTLDAAKNLQDLLQRSPVTSKEALTNLDMIRNLNISTDKLTITSSYFLVETVVSIEKQRILLYTLLERTLKNNRATLRIVWQSKGIW